MRTQLAGLTIVGLFSSISIDRCRSSGPSAARTGARSRSPHASPSRPGSSGVAARARCRCTLARFNQMERNSLRICRVRCHPRLDAEPQRERGQRRCGQRRNLRWRPRPYHLRYAQLTRGLQIGRAPQVGEFKASAQVEMDFLGNEPSDAERNANVHQPRGTRAPLFSEIEDRDVDFLFGQTWQLFGWQGSFHPNTVQIQGVPGECSDARRRPASRTRSRPTRSTSRSP